MQYQRVSPLFHQWADTRLAYGLNFATSEEAQSFAQAIDAALIKLGARFPLLFFVQNLRLNPAHQSFLLQQKFNRQRQCRCTTRMDTRGDLRGRLCRQRAEAEEATALQTTYRRHRWSQRRIFRVSLQSAPEEKCLPSQDLLRPCPCQALLPRAMLQSQGPISTRQRRRFWRRFGARSTLQSERFSKRLRGRTEVEAAAAAKQLCHHHRNEIESETSAKGWGRGKRKKCFGVCGGFNGCCASPLLVAAAVAANGAAVFQQSAREECSCQVARKTLLQVAECEVFVAFA